MMTRRTNTIVNNPDALAIFGLMIGGPLALN
jgi:hypothetical protein